MAKNVNVSFLGDAELDKKLASLDLKMQKKIAHQACKVAIAPVLDMAKALCPVGTGKTGDRTRPHLRDTLKVFKLTKQKGRRVGYGVFTGSRETLLIDPKDKHYWPMAVEVGHGNSSAKPYLRPAIHSQRGRLLSILGSELGRLLEAEVK